MSARIACCIRDQRQAQDRDIETERKSENVCIRDRERMYVFCTYICVCVYIYMCTYMGKAGRNGWGKREGEREGR